MPAPLIVFLFCLHCVSLPLTLVVPILANRQTIFLSHITLLTHPHTLTPSLGADPAGPAVTGTFRSKRWPVDCPVPGCKGEKGARGDVGPSGPRVRVYHSLTKFVLFIIESIRTELCDV